MTTPYNPLDKLNLARSIETELLSSMRRSFDQLAAIEGAGVYAIYYSGQLPFYEPISGTETPIYVGKAIPRGGRKGGLGANAAVGRALRDRLGHHAASISEAENLNVVDFTFRYLVVDDIWIPLGENMLIESMQPVWNVVIDGFGNKDPGARRVTQYKSPWDVLHPGRNSMRRQADNPFGAAIFAQRLSDFFQGRSVPLIEDTEPQADS